MADPIRIPLEGLQSSNLAAAGYDSKRQILAVQFNGGHIFHYAPVPPEQAAAFYGAESKGKYYGQHIKGKVSGQKMTGMCAQCGGGPGWLGDTCDDCGTATYTEARHA